MYPTLEQVKQISQNGDYRRIPVCRELLADRFTPVEVIRTLRAASRHCYLLESAESGHQWGRYSFLGYSPTLELTCRDGTLRLRSVNHEGMQEEQAVATAHPGRAIREIRAQYRSPKVEGMPPFTGGLVGYFSYDYIKYAEPTLCLSSGPDADFQDMDLMLFDKVIAFDHGRQKLILITGVNPARLEESYSEAAWELDEMARLLNSGARADFQPLRLTSPLAPVYSKEDYCKMVERAKQYIREGDIFQVVLSDPLTAPAQGSLFDAYRVLRTENPSPYMFYFSSDDVEIAGASPETLVKLEDGVLHTFPLAGTRPRGETAKEDLRLEQELLAHKSAMASSSLGRVSVGQYFSKISKNRGTQSSAHRTNVLCVCSSTNDRKGWINSLSLEKSIFLKFNAALSCSTLIILH